jgi:hypothetical protein
MDSFTLRVLKRTKDGVIDSDCFYSGFWRFTYWTSTDWYNSTTYQHGAYVIRMGCCNGFGTDFSANGYLFKLEKANMWPVRGGA